MDQKIGFIGMGNMASAMVAGFIAAGRCQNGDIIACARDFERLQARAASVGIRPVRTPEEVIDESDIVIIAIKPYQIEAVIPPLQEKLRGKTVLSVVGGWDFDKYETVLAEGTHHLYIMPNTPVKVNEGVLMFEEKHSLSAEELACVTELMACLGTVVTLPSHLMNAGMSIAGCGPAFVAMMIEALGDAGVKYGLQRKTAYALAAQTLAGTGKLHLATGEHPGAMKDAVCSPAGTTIKGVTTLEREGFRNALIAAIDSICS